MAVPTQTETRTIITNTDRLLCVHYTAVTTGGGGDTAVNTIVDIDDASNYSHNGVALSADGFNSSTGVPLTSLTVEKLWSTVDVVTVTANFHGRLEFDATTNVGICGVGANYATAIGTHFDYTPFGGLQNTKASGFTGNIVLTHNNMGTVGDSVAITLQMKKVY
jgi:hypothetical protein